MNKIRYIVYFTYNDDEYTNSYYAVFDDLPEKENLEKSIGEIYAGLNITSINKIIKEEITQTEL